MLISLVTCAGLMLAAWLWLSARRGAWGRPATLGWLACALILLDLGSAGAYQDLGNEDPSRAFHQDAIAAFLQGQPGPFRIDTRTDIAGQWQPDTALLYGIEDVGGLVNPLILADVERYWQGLGSRSTPLYDLLNVRYVVAKKDVTLDWDHFSLAFDGSPDLNVYQNRSALPRAFCVPAWTSAAGHEAAWQAIHRPDFDPAALAVVEGAGVAAGRGGTGTVTAVRTTADGLALDVTVTSGPALLLLSQVWYPGWQVWVDGREHGAPLRVDYLFQGARA